MPTKGKREPTTAPFDVFLLSGYFLFGFMKPSAFFTMGSSSRMVKPEKRFMSTGRSSLFLQTSIHRLMKDNFMSPTISFFAVAHIVIISFVDWQRRIHFARIVSCIWLPMECAPVFGLCHLGVGYKTYFGTVFWIITSESSSDLDYG